MQVVLDWDSLPRKRVLLPSPPRTQIGGTHSGGGGGPNSGDWAESLALCILCAHYILPYYRKVEANANASFLRKLPKLSEWGGDDQLTKVGGGGGVGWG